MKIIEFSLNNVPTDIQVDALCLGYFDGVHLGHKAIIQKSLNEGYNSSVLSFDVSPSIFLKKHIDVGCLTTDFDKANIFTSLGVSNFFVLKFDQQISNLSKDEFIDRILKILNPSIIYVGEDYRFGKGGEGTPEYLSKFFNVQCIDFVRDGNEKISSRVIKECVKNGLVEKANELLGHYYFISGIVAPGLQNGRKIGFPTANLSLKGNYIIPATGVYIGYANVNDTKYRAIINIGTHPTINELEKQIVEVHLLDFDGDIYGKDLTVSFVKRIRDEKTFDSFIKLKEQLEKDKELAKNHLR